MMKPIKQWKKSTTLTTFFWAVTAALSVSAYATTSATREASQSAALEALLSDQRNSIIQSSNSCAEVVPPNGLYVRREPTVYSEAIGILEYRANVIPEAGGTEEWLPISAPLKGYVWRGWIAPCGAAPEVPSAPPEVEALPSAN